MNPGKPFEIRATVRRRALASACKCADSAARAACGSPAARRDRGDRAEARGEPAGRPDLGVRGVGRADCRRRHPALRGSRRLCAQLLGHEAADRRQHRHSRHPVRQPGRFRAVGRDLCGWRCIGDGERRPAMHSSTSPWSKCCAARRHAVRQNTVAGALNVRTAKPTDEFEAMVRRSTPTRIEELEVEGHIGSVQRHVARPARRTLARERQGLGSQRVLRQRQPRERRDLRQAHARVGRDRGRPRQHCVPRTGTSTSTIPSSCSRPAC